MSEIETRLLDALDKLSRLHESTLNACDERLTRLETQGKFLLQLLDEQSRRLNSLAVLLNDLPGRRSF